MRFLAVATARAAAARGRDPFEAGRNDSGKRDGATSATGRLVCHPDLARYPNDASLLMA